MNKIIIYIILCVILIIGLCFDNMVDNVENVENTEENRVDIENIMDNVKVYKIERTEYGELIHIEYEGQKYSYYIDYSEIEG